MKGEFPLLEIFDSIDGEGKRTGYMATFIRFCGCPLRCTYCDTAYALDENMAEEWVTGETLLSRIRAYPWKRLTWTGGEPMLRPIRSLCDELGREGYESNIETSGAIPLWDVRPANTFYTMDWKCPDSGMERRMCIPNLARLTGEDVLKFVVGSERDLFAMERVIHRHFQRENCPRFYVSPVFGKIHPQKLVEFVRDHELADVCVQVQLHKVIWDPNMRGV